MRAPASLFGHRRRWPHGWQSEQPAAAAPRGRSGRRRPPQVKRDDLCLTGNSRIMRHIWRTNGRIWRMFYCKCRIDRLVPCRDDLKKSILGLVMRLLAWLSFSVADIRGYGRNPARDCVKTFVLRHGRRAKVSTRDHRVAANRLIRLRTGLMRHPVAFLRHLSHLRAAMRAGAAGNLRLWCVGLEQGHLMRDAIRIWRGFCHRPDRVRSELDERAWQAQPVGAEPAPGCRRSNLAQAEALITRRRRRHTKPARELLGRVPHRFSVRNRRRSRSPGRSSSPPLPCGSYTWCPLGPICWARTLNVDRPRRCTSSSFHTEMMPIARDSYRAVHACASPTRRCWGRSQPCCRRCSRGRATPCSDSGVGATSRGRARPRGS